MIRKLVGIDHLSEELAWELVAPLFSRRVSIVLCGLILLAVGVAGFLDSGSGLYLICASQTALAILWRRWEVLSFARTRAARGPVEWGARSLVGAWALGLSWGGWCSVVSFETRPGLLIMVLGVHAALVTSEAARNHSIPVVARGQVLLASVPIAVACLVNPDMFLNLYAGFVLFHAVITMQLIADLHREKLQTLLNEVQAVELSSKLAAANDELNLVNQHLEALVATDPLTGLLNRRAFDLAAARAWRAAAREEQPMALLMVDIDHFKLFNDFYGHQAGDDCLRSVAALLDKMMQRPGDLLARFGGEEFIVVLPTTEPAGALAVAERILTSLRARALTHALAPSGVVTVSVGVATAMRVQTTTLHALIAAADKALYAAKRAGRDCASVQETAEEQVAVAELDELFTVPEERGKRVR